MRESTQPLLEAAAAKTYTGLPSTQRVAHMWLVEPDRTTFPPSLQFSRRSPVNKVSTVSCRSSIPADHVWFFPPSSAAVTTMLCLVLRWTVRARLTLQAVPDPQTF